MTKSSRSSRKAHKRANEGTNEDLSHEDPDRQETSNNDTARPGKKARIELEETHDVPPTPMPESLVFKLPLEILGEILVLTESPRHVLAFARTCKHFCYTLIGEGAQYIWRRARRGSQVSFLEFNFADGVQPHLGVEVIFLPDPPKQFFGEAAYAAFLFDPGPCNNCGKETSEMYASFESQTRLCNRQLCRRQPLSGFTGQLPLISTDEINEITAWSEQNGLSYWLNGISSETGIVNLARRDGETYLSWHRRKNEWMTFCSSLATWKIQFNEKCRQVREDNEQVAHQAADVFGWEYTDMKSSTVFGTFFQRKSRFLEPMSPLDVYPLRDQIESELLALQEKRRRRRTEAALMKNREDVEALYNRLRAKKAYSYMPSLPAFRQLPVVRLLQSGTYEKSGTTISDTLQGNALMRGQLDQDVERWVESAKQDLAVVLGFPRDWKSANRKALHPVERVTAWFLCTKCDIDRTNSKTSGCLNFAGACLHVCQTKDGKYDRFRRSKNPAWNPANFIKDEKPINLMKSALSKLMISEEILGPFHSNQHDLAVLCTSCEPSVVLDSRNLIEHCHRHDRMELSFLGCEQAERYLNGFAYSYGIVAKLLQQGGKAIKREIDKKNFGCRICLSLKQVKESVPDRASLTGNEDRMEGQPQRTVKLGLCSPSEKPKEMPTLFTFNGIRSHLKAKHGIQNIHDEDIFCSVLF